MCWTTRLTNVRARTRDLDCDMRPPRRTGRHAASRHALAGQSGRASVEATTHGGRNASVSLSPNPRLSSPACSSVARIRQAHSRAKRPPEEACGQFRAPASPARGPPCPTQYGIYVSDASEKYGMSVSSFHACDLLLCVGFELIQCALDEGVRTGATLFPVLDGSPGSSEPLTEGLSRFLQSVAQHLDALRCPLGRLTRHAAIVSLAVHPSPVFKGVRLTALARDRSVVDWTSRRCSRVLAR